jgi:AraC-like DNA-binding protein
VASQIQELAGLIEQYATEEGPNPTIIPRVVLHRVSQVSAPLHTVYEPAVCFVAQGRKRVMAGDNVYVYQHAQYLIISVDVPIESQLLDASPERPFLCMRLDLDRALIAALMLEADIERAGREQPCAALEVSSINDELLDAAVRLVRLLGSPADISILAPLAEREILYRLLKGAQASRMSQIAFAESKLQQINLAIGWIKTHFREHFSIEVLATEAGMSSSALHQHFKAVTAMSPLQYQKLLRLQEARRLILAHSLEAAAVAYSVGYESPSQFSREYRRLFGAPPAQDGRRLRANEFEDV